MISVIETYDDIIDLLNEESNGQFSYKRFNNYSWLAQLRLMDWLSGDVSALQPPEPYLSQKNLDWLSPFITKITGSVSKTGLVKPSDYYKKEDLYTLGSYSKQDCETGIVETIDDGNTPIELLDGPAFTIRSKSYIKGIKPDFDSPIAKIVDNVFVFDPQDLGSVALEYLRLPAKAKIVTKMDTVYNEEVPDESASINFEWDEAVRPILEWFITDLFINRISNQAAKQLNEITGKTVRK